MLGTKKFWIKVGALIGFVLFVGKVGAAIVIRALDKYENSN